MAVTNPMDPGINGGPRQIPQGELEDGSGNTSAVAGHDPMSVLISNIQELVQIQKETKQMTMTSLSMEGTLHGDRGSQAAAHLLANVPQPGPGGPGAGFLAGMTRMGDADPVLRRSNVAYVKREAAQRIGEFIASKAGGVNYWDPEAGTYVSSETYRQFGAPPAGLGRGAVGPDPALDDPDVSSARPGDGDGAAGGGSGGGGRGGSGNAPGDPVGPSGEPPAGSGGGRGSRMFRNMARNQALRHIGGAVAKSGGTRAGLMAGLREVPYVGWGIMAAEAGDKVYNETLDQIDENRDYQRITGSTMAGATHDRAHEWVWSHLQTGVESTREAREQFESATQLGYRGDDRTGALHWMRHETALRGMDVEQERKTLEVATRNGVTSFASLSKAIFDVSKAAHEAGVNAEEARDKFISMFSGTTSMGFGTSAAPVADVLTSTVTSYGRTFNGVDYGGLNNRQMQYRLAAQSGMSPGQFQAQAIKNPMGYAQAVQKNINQVIQNSIPDSVLRQVAATVDRYGGTKALQGNPDLVNTVAEDVQSQGLMDVGVLTDLLAQTGVQGITQATAWAYVIQNMIGNGPAAQAADKIAQSGIVDTKTGNYVGGPRAGQHARNVLSGQQLADLGTHSTMAAQYVASVNKTGQQDTVISGIYKSLGSNADKARVVVQTKDGNKVVSMEQAQRDYRKELDSGKVRFATGTKDSSGKDITGQTVQQLTGLGMQGLDTSDEVSGSKSGEKEDTYNKHHKKKDKHEVSGTLIVQPPFDQMFKVMMGSSPGSTGTGLPPTNPYVSNPSARPGTVDAATSP